MLEVRDLTFRHGDGKGYILKRVSFTAHPCQITTILGPNGAGKTTLFKCITGLWRGYKGTVRVDGSPLDPLGPKRRARIFSVVPQEHDPPFPYKVFDVVLMGRASHLGLFSAPGKRDYRVANEALEMLGIGHLKEVPYTQISGGERQLVLIARALAQEAPIMVLDEPTSHLDFRNQVLVLKRIREVVKGRGLVALLTLHDPNLASAFSDKIVMLNRGEVLCEGPPEEVLSEEALWRLYGVEVKVIREDGRKLVLPFFDDHS